MGERIDSAARLLAEEAGPLVVSFHSEDGVICRGGVYRASDRYAPFWFALAPPLWRTDPVGSPEKAMQAAEAWCRANGVPVIGRAGMKMPEKAEGRG